jgi:hypothetical protein
MYISDNDRYTFFTFNNPDRSYPARDIVADHYSGDYHCLIIDIYSINYKQDIEFQHILDHMLPYKRSQRPHKLIIDAAYEAPTYRYHLKTFMDWMATHLSIPLKDQIIFSGSQHQFDDPVCNSTCISMAITHVVLKDSTHDLVPQHHYISLARTAKRHRLLTTIEILDRGLESYGHMSLGSGYYNNPAENSLLLAETPIRYQDKFPLYIDGLIAPGGSPDNQHYASHPKMTLAFCNVVQETSYDPDITPGNWNTPFITEKSTKPFAWGQVPIFIGAQGHIPPVRELGFDLFDDIIDHKYNDEPDGRRRIVLAVDQLEKICALPISRWQEYKQKNMHRFANNRAIAENLYRNNKQTMQKPNTENLLRVLNS